MIAGDAVTGTDEVGADPDRAVGMHHHPLPKLDRTIAVKLRVAGELGLRDEALRQPHRYPKTARPYLLGDLVVNGHPVFRLRRKISGPGIHRDADLKQVVEIDLHNPKRLGEPDHRLKLEIAVLGVVEEKFLHAAGDSHLVSAGYGAAHRVDATYERALAAQRVVGLG
jgi:hypothetical protein